MSKIILYFEPFVNDQHFFNGRNGGMLISAARGVPERKCQRHSIPWPEFLCVFRRNFSSINYHTKAISSFIWPEIPIGSKKLVFLAMLGPYREYDRLSGKERNTVTPNSANCRDITLANWLSVASIAVFSSDLRAKRNSGLLL